MSEPASGSESTRDLAAQRRPEDASTPTAARPHFEPPGWLGPDRGHAAPATSGLIPEQVAPRHDAVAPPPAAAPAVLGSGHWKGSGTGRTAGGLLLIASVVATLGAAGLLLQDRTGDNVILLVICVLVTIGIWSVMAASTPMEVELQGSMLRVRHHNTEDTFDLADPYQDVELRGAVGSPSWSLALGRRDGSTVVVGSRTVPAAQLHPVVLHHRRRAEQRGRERDSRFRR